MKRVGKYLTHTKKVEMAGQRLKITRHIEDKQQNGRCKSCLICNHIKCKWIKHLQLKGRDWQDG